MSARLARGSALLALALAGCSVAAADEPPEAPGEAAGVRAFQAAYRVLLSPRCRNCHPSGDAPLQRDEGVPHRMNITRRSPEVGLPCTACHRSKNAPMKRGPPGVPNWHMPPREHPMIFEGRSPAELCEQLKDPEETGGKSARDLVDHVREDRLVLWAWDPGPGRSRPPLSHRAFVDAVSTWVAAGAPCP